MKLTAITSVLVACAWLATGLQADETIEVTSEGVVEVAPNLIWIEGSLSGSGDLAEAKKVLAGLKEDIRKVLENEDFKDIKIVYGSRNVTAGPNNAMDMQRQMMEMMGEGGPPADTDGIFTLSENFRLTLSGITEAKLLDESERMLRLSEALTDKQIKLGQAPNPMAYYNGQNMGQFMRVGLEDPDLAWKQASQTAFTSAKSKATALAEIAGGDLGKAVSVSVENNLADPEQGQMGLPGVVMAMGLISSAAPAGVSQASLDRISVKVQLRIRFEFIPK
ncbi:MAG: SIMPL domain-containing protein [Planctomycetaceae bacterium]|nr:SIMPL domain-containing protein [Planctomycetaceae bacterium]